MAKEYIEREATIRAFPEAEEHPFQNCQYCTCLDSERIGEILDNIPAADVAPVRHAIWRYKTMTVPGGRGQTYAKWSCTACKAKQKERSNYCPNCGALMDKGGDGDG